MSCLICGKDAGTFETPNKATVWETQGNYGSTVYDPGHAAELDLSSYSLQAYVCDACLRGFAHRIRSVRRWAPKPTEEAIPGILDPNDWPRKDQEG